MSRSYKKPWVKDPANRYMKKIHARAFRSRCRQISRVFKKHWKSADDPEYPSKHQVSNQYDVCDYIFYVSRYRMRSRVWKDHRYLYCQPYWEDNTKAYLNACRK